MSEEILLVEKAPEGYAVLTLNRPQSLNAWSVALCTRFCEAFSALQEDDAVRAVILTGTGRAFCAGLDVKEMRADPDAFFARVRAHSPGVALQAGRKPVIGAINGDAVTGGFEIALLCDILICSENASFMDTHTRIGLMPGWGISQLLSRRVGISRAKEISLTARRVGAAEAAAIGPAVAAAGGGPQDRQGDAGGRSPHPRGLRATHRRRLRAAPARRPRPRAGTRARIHAAARRQLTPGA
jgi:enoyl-CoA hydratase